MEIVVLTVILGLLFDYTNGFHDAANVVSTPIATRALRPITAIVMATVFNFLGATQISGVAHTITSGLVQSQAASEVMVLAAIGGAIFWNFLTWYFGIPSSSSYALVGGLMGAAVTAGGHQIILWNGLIYKVIIPMLLSPFIGFFIALFFMKLLLKLPKKNNSLFRYLQIGSASVVALAHGLNDAQKSMGIITLGLLAGGIIQTPHIPLWVITSCALMMALGTATGGFRIIRVMGFEITKLQPAQGFAAESSASLVILVASFLGMPLSSTHIIVGGITGVGAARGGRFVQWKTAKKLGWAWFLTIPGSGLASSLFFKLFISIFF